MGRTRGKPERKSEKQAAANKRNGALGGAPPKPTLEQELTREQAFAKGRSLLTRAVLLWEQLLKDELPEATIMDRLTAAREIANRCGMPTRTESEIVGDKPLTMMLVQVEGGLGWPAPVAADDTRADDASKH